LFFAPLVLFFAHLFSLPNKARLFGRKKKENSIPGTAPIQLQDSDIIDAREE
jgi:hypothetical protein